MLCLIALTCSLSAQSRTGLIVGQVVDGATGRPVSGVMVELGVPDESLPRGTRPPQPVMTDDSGGFVFSGLFAGLHGITARRGGYAEGAYGRLRPGGFATSLPLAEGERKGDIKIRIWKFAAITGTVTDEIGEPAVDVRVRALRVTYLAGHRQLVSESIVSTDDRGVYRLGALVPGDYVVIVPSTQTTVPADIAAEASASTGSPTARALGILRPMGRLSANTKAIATSVGAFVVQSSSQALTVSGSATQTNSRLAVYPTTYNGDATTARQAASIAIGSGETRSGVDMHLRPRPAVRVSGRLIGPEGSVGLQALRLFLASSDDLVSDQGFESAAALTDRSGAFTFLGVPPGQYVLRANTFTDNRAGRGGPPPGSTADPLWLAEPVLVGNQDVTINATWRDAFSLSGRAVFDGVGAPAGNLSRIPILTEAVDQRQPSGSTDISRFSPDGTFSTPRIPAGRYLVRIGSPPTGWALRSVMYEGRDISDVGLDLKGSVTDIVMTFTNRITSLSGTVTTLQGLAASDATALLFPVDSEGWQDFGLNPRRLESERVQSNGTYSFPDIPAGDYFVVAVPEEQAAVWREPGRLTSLSRVATRVHLTEGQKATQELRQVDLR